MAGAIRTSKGIEFENGTKLAPTATGGLQQTLANGTVVTNATGTGTLNRVAKWTDNVGTLGDALISESSGSVVVGNAGQTGKIQIFGTAVQDVFAGMGPDINVGPSFNYGYAGSSFGRGAGFFNVRPDASATPPNPSLRFMTANVERMIITNAGNAGIGTTNPTAKLDVAGDINTSTQLNIGGQPALRSFPASGNLFAGVNAGLNTAGLVFGNAFFGTSAGLANTSGVNNAFFGTSAGDTNTTGDFNTMIGPGADVGSTNLDNATAIGQRALVTQSNSLVLGSINGQNGATTDTNVGIGTTAPTHRLTVGQLEPPVVTNALVGVYGSGSAFSIVRDTTNNVEGLFGANANGALYGSTTNHGVHFSNQQHHQDVHRPQWQRRHRDDLSRRKTRSQ